MNYYNEYDKHAAAWLRELIAQGLIPAGDVDERSICDVSAADLQGYTQCHFFAGIGGWSYAMQLAGWPASRPVWSASCPCQPFSTAGKGLAQADERHLWPVFFNLLKECRPQYVFGEQVASAIGHGWLDGISADLEAEGYACGSVVLGAHSVGAPHIRQRLYWAAYNASERLEGTAGSQLQGNGGGLARGCEAGGMADSHNAGSQGRLGTELRECPDQCASRQSSTSSGTGWVGNSNSEQTDSTKQRQQMSSKGLLRCWDASRLILCRDGKYRRIPTEPAFFPLAHGIPARVVRLRGYGNAIVPQVAAEFIQAAEESLNLPAS